MGMEKEKGTNRDFASPIAIYEEKRFLGVFLDIS